MTKTQNSKQIKTLRVKRFFTTLTFLLLLICSLSCSRSPGLRVVKVGRGTFNIKVHAVGRLQSAASVYIGCPTIHRIWNYTISSMAPEGEKVKAGTIVLSFDPKELMEKLTLKNSELETSKKDLERNRLVEQEKQENYILQLAEARVRTKKAKRKSIQQKKFTALIDVKKFLMDYELAKLNEELSRSRVENHSQAKKTRIHSLESKVKRLGNEVSRLRDAVERMNVKAPKPGIVVYAADWRGRKKAVGDDCWMGDKILELPDLSRMQVTAAIPEPQAGKVKQGLPVEIRLDSNPDKVFKGNIESLGRIFRARSSDQPNIVFDTIISIEAPDPGLMRPGMAAGVDIIISSRENVLQVPEAAVIYHEDGLFVWKKSFLGKKKVQVTLGTRSGGMVEVLKGLKENDRLIIMAGGNGEE